MLALKTSKQTVTRFAFSANGSHLAAAGTGRKVHLWDMTAKKLRAKSLPTFRDATEWIGFLPSGMLFTISSMGEYARHDPVAGTTDAAALKRWSIGDVVAEPDGSAFYGTGWEARKWALDGRLQEVWNAPVPGGGFFYGRGGAVLTPAGEYIAAIMVDGRTTRLHVRAALGGAFRGEHVLSPCLVSNLTLLPDGRTLVFLRHQEYQGETPNAIVTGTVNGAFEPVLVAPEPDTFSALALHPSGERLAVGHSDGTVRVFDVGTWREVKAYQWPVRPVAGLAFAPDGLRAAAGGADGRIVVWDVDL